MNRRSLHTSLLVLWVVLCLCVAQACSRNTVSPGGSTEPAVIITPAGSSPDGTDAPSDAPTSDAGTETPSAPTDNPTDTPPVQVTANPNGETSANPAYAGKKLVALTFDDGPSISYTGAMLDMLKEKGVKATFFVCGYELGMESQKDLIRREKAEGHEIGQHSYDHKTFTHLSVEDMRKQIEDTDALIYEAIGETPHLFRPPGGGFNQTVLDTVGTELGKTFVLWSIDSNDWDHINLKNSIIPYAESHGISQEEAQAILIDELLFKGWDKGSTHYPPIVPNIKHGSIILFHDIHPASRVAAAQLIDYLQSTGEYVFMTVSELIETESAAPQPGEVYYTMWKR